MRTARTIALTVTGLVLAAMLMTAGPAAAADATWTGASSTDTWSTGANWSGGIAPSGSVGVLTLPPSAATCLGWACVLGVDDIPGLTVGTLQIDASNDYLVAPLTGGAAITLLSGLSFGSTSPPTSGRLVTRMVVPLALGGAQSWNIAAVAGTHTELALGAVTGESYPLTLRLSGGVRVQAPEIDTGPLTVSGGGTLAIANQLAQPVDGVPVFPPPLVSGQGVTLAHGASLAFTGPGAVSGPISVAAGSYSTLSIGHGYVPDGTATVLGDVTLRANSTLQLWIDQADPNGRPQPSIDASRLTVFGTMNLNDAGLALSQGFTDAQVDCAALTGGQTYTLLSATRLSGTFAGIAGGQVVPLGACNPLASGPGYAVILRYNTGAQPQTVTATVVGPAQISALVARTLAVPPAAARLTAVSAAGGYVTSFNAPTAGTLALTWTAVSHHRRVTVATGANTAGQVGPRRVAITLTSAGRRLLRAAEAAARPKPRPKRSSKHRPRPRPKPRPLVITATAHFTPVDQSESAVVATRRVTLR